MVLYVRILLRNLQSKQYSDFKNAESKIKNGSIDKLISDVMLFYFKTHTYTYTYTFYTNRHDISRYRMIKQYQSTIISM